MGLGVDAESGVQVFLQGRNICNIFQQGESTRLYQGGRAHFYRHREFGGILEGKNLECIDPGALIPCLRVPLLPNSTLALA